MSDKEYVMKDSPRELVEAAGVEPQGRKYDAAFTSEPGAVRIEDVVTGMKYASLAITDDEPDTLKKIGKGNPWHIEALRIITGSESEAHKPLSHILPTHMGLKCDEIIDVSGMAKNGQFLDTQGYIAHNDEVIVLAYRCTTSAKDWLTNLSTTSSAWEPEEDLEQGHSGYCSGLEGLCCYEGEYRPRVHTGFYNNFLSTLPYIKQHILPLLEPDQPPRKLYVVGHSLGAGIATMAACYFLLHVDWEVLPHKFLAITAGSPRACQDSMFEAVQARMATLRPMDKAVICRLVRDRDCVPNLPPSILGFRHLKKLVYITDDGDILINPKLKDDHVLDEKEMQSLIASNPDIADELSDSDDEDEELSARTKAKRKKSKYEKMVSKIPAPFRDHMPDFYLVPLIKLFENETGIPQNIDPPSDDEEEEEEQAKEEDEGRSTRSGRSTKSARSSRSSNPVDDVGSSDQASPAETAPESGKKEDTSSDKDTSSTNSSSSDSPEAESPSGKKPSGEKKKSFLRVFSRKKKKSKNAEASQ